MNKEPENATTKTDPPRRSRLAETGHDDATQNLLDRIMGGRKNRVDVAAFQSSI
jgi:hypothetical protein